MNISFDPTAYLPKYTEIKAYLYQGYAGAEKARRVIVEIGATLVQIGKSLLKKISQCLSFLKEMLLRIFSAILDFFSPTSPDGRQIKYIIGDGNCLCRAVSYALYQTQERHEELRADLCKYLQEHRADADFDPILQGELINYNATPGVSPIENIEAFIENSSSTGFWLGHSALYALSLLHKIQIEILFADSRIPTQIINQDQFEKKITLYYTGNHYNVVLD